MSIDRIGPEQLSDEAIKKKLDAFDTVPLFMQSLPEDSESLEADPTLAALQSLVHEGTPDEVALNFKDQGNEYFRGKRFREAMGFYTQGIDAKPTDIMLQEALLCNRAACNLELQNYGSVLRDCSKALTLNSRSNKAYYRSTLALIALERAEEALDCCSRCLAYDHNNDAIKALQEKASKLKAEKDQREKERQRRLENERQAKRKLDLAFMERNLIVMANPSGTVNPYTPHFDPEDLTEKTLIFPVFFLYPQHATSDVIPEFVEDTPFVEHLKVMFPPSAPPPEWDRKMEYAADKLVVYAMTMRKRILKVGKKMSLRDVCAAAKSKDGTKERDGLELKDGCLTFVVVPKGPVEEQWIEEYKRRRDD